MTSPPRPTIQPPTSRRAALARATERRRDERRERTTRAMEEFTSALIYAPAKAFGDGDAARDVRARVR